MMVMMRRAWAFAAFASACPLVLSGCGDGGPALVSVTGTVMQNGKPLEGAAVMFLPDSPGEGGQPAEDTTGSDGNYKLMTRDQAGAVPGKYHVTVTRAPSAAAAAANPAFKDDPYMANFTMSGDPVAKKKEASSSPLEYTIEREITQENPQVQDIDVKIKSTDSK